MVLGEGKGDGFSPTSEMNQVDCTETGPEAKSSINGELSPPGMLPNGKTVEEPSSVDDLAEKTQANCHITESSSSSVSGGKIPTFDDSQIEEDHNMKKNEEDFEDRYGFLLEQIRRSEEHIPLHKSVCCALCRKKELRVRKTMQDRRSYSCPGTDEGPMINEYYTQESTFARMSQPYTRHHTFLAEVPDVETDGYNADRTEENSSSNSSPFIRSLNSEEFLSNIVNGSQNDDVITGNGIEPYDKTQISFSAKQQDDPPLDAVEETKETDFDSSESHEVKQDQCGEQQEETKHQKRLANGHSKAHTFKRSVSLNPSDEIETGSTCSDRKPFTSRRYESFRLPRDPTADLRPITDPVLLQKLQTAMNIQSSDLKMSPKDQKLLALYLARREQQRQLELRRESSHMKREDGKRRVSSSSSSSSSSSFGLRRQHSMNDAKVQEACNRRHSLQHTGVKLTQQSFRDCSHPNNEPSCCPRCAGHVASSSTKDHVVCNDEHHCLPNDEPCKYCSRYSATLTPSDKQQTSKKQFQQALERKVQVEQHLKDQKQKTEKYLAQLKEKREQEQQRAMITRQEKTKQLSDKSKLHNMRAYQKLKEVKENKKLTMEEIAAVHEEKQAQLTAAELKVKQLRESEKAKIENELKRKLERSQQKQHHLEEELTRWQNELQEYRQMQESNAQSLAMATLAKKRETAAKDRETKERQQKENLTRMLEREKEWRAGLEASIQSKDARSKMMQEEKEKLIKRSREAALTSRRIREELRLNLSMTDLDLIAQQDQQ